MTIFSEAKCKTAWLLAAGWALSGLTDISHKKSSTMAPWQHQGGVMTGSAGKKHFHSSIVPSWADAGAQQFNTVINHVQAEQES